MCKKSLKQNEYQFGFWYKYHYISINQKHLSMSRELIEVSEQIDEQFEIEEIDLEAEDFWQSVVNLFI